MPRILDQPILRQGRQFEPPPGVDEIAKLLRDSEPGSQVAADETYPSRHAAQVAAGRYKYWLRQRYDLDVTTNTFPAHIIDGAKNKWAFAVRFPTN